MNDLPIELKRIPRTKFEYIKAVTFYLAQHNIYLTKCPLKQDKIPRKNI